MVRASAERALGRPGHAVFIIASSRDRKANDQNVDAVYIGTPHTFHYENAKAALQAGKHVLCEKPFTFDLSELDELIALAKEKKLFLME